MSRACLLFHLNASSEPGMGGGGALRNPSSSLKQNEPEIRYNTERASKPADGGVGLAGDCVRATARIENAVPYFSFSISSRCRSFGSLGT